MSSIQIPVANADTRGDEGRYVSETIRSSWVSWAGPFVTEFQRTFGELCGATSCLGVCNSTAARHLGLVGLGVRLRDEVLVPLLTHVATANACRYVGAEPMSVDVDPATWCGDPGKLAAAITRRTRGGIAVHPYGNAADLDAIAHLDGVRGFWVVEDAQDEEDVGIRDQRRRVQ